MTSRINFRTAAAIAVIGFALSACGGGGGGGSDPGPGSGGGIGTGAGVDPAVSSAFSSVTAFMAFLQQLTATADDTGEPLALPDSPAPTSDADEPSA